MKVNTGPGGWKDGKVKLKVAGVWKDQIKSFTKTGGQWKAEVSDVGGILKYESVVGVGYSSDGTSKDYGFNGFGMGSISQTTLFGLPITSCKISNYELPALRSLLFTVAGEATNNLKTLNEIYVNGIRGVADPASISYIFGYSRVRFTLDSVPPLSGQWEVKIYGK